MADIFPITVEVITAAIFQTCHSRAVFAETSRLVGQTVDKRLPHVPSCEHRNSLEKDTFNAINDCLQTHFNVGCRRIPLSGLISRYERERESVVYWYSI
jgi:hypothetical protein